MLQLLLTRRPVSHITGASCRQFISLPRSEKKPAEPHPQDLLHLAEQARKIAPKSSPISPPPAAIASSGLRLCRTCNTFKPPGEFYKLATAVDGLRRHCKVCEGADRLAYRSTLRGSVKKMMANTQGRARRRKRRCELTFDDIVDMLVEQGGYCAYSGVPLSLKPHTHWRMSLECMDNDRDYDRANCLLVAAEFNTGDIRGRQTSDGTALWSRDKVLRVLQLRAAAVDASSLDRLVGEARWATCSPLHRRFARILKDAAKIGHRGGFRCSLSVDDLFDKILAQRGRCYFSQVPLELVSTSAAWRICFERLDHNDGYTLENTKLIANEFLVPNFSRGGYEAAGVVVQGTAAWTREKVEHIWGPPP